MEGEYFTFEASDFQVLEDIDFDETIQRPEEIRFYTLAEQVTDAFEKQLPSGKVTKFQLEVLQKEVDRLKDLYETYIVPTADTYLIRERVHRQVFDWISPVYATSDLVEYDFNTSWDPLFAEESIKLPNFYPRMLASLPRPFLATDNGHPYRIYKTTDFVDSTGVHPIRGLPMYDLTKTNRHEDGTFDIMHEPVQGTEDLINFIGYYARKRSVDVPNPLQEHPFLKSADAVFINSTSLLSEIVPSMDAVLTHAVPVTHDPYREGMKYLKVYDIKLQDIPWKSWKSKFPEAEEVRINPELEELKFPKHKLENLSPLIDLYERDYFPGMSSRYWLSTQVDGGELVTHMLMSQAGQSGSVELRPGVDVSDHRLPPAAMADCDLLGLNFTDFTVRGTVRRTWDIKRGEDVITYTCMPLELVRQERANVGFKQRLAWKETTPDTILKSYLRDLKFYKPMGGYVEKKLAESKTPTREVSQQRQDILAIMDDKRRFAEDKLSAINELVREATLTGEIYSDSQGSFVICRHTIAALEGDLARDMSEYYAKWTARVDGFRVCKYCSEQLEGNILIEQAEFDDSGRLIKHSDVLATAGFHGHGISQYATSIETLKNLFVFKDPADEVFFMLISLLQVLPNIDQLMPILTIGRSFAPSIPKDSQGVIGIAQAVLLFQTHVPTLVPRRSFGSRPLTIAGFPRDTAVRDGFTIVDSMMLVLQKTLQAYPTSFKGSSVQVMRAILNKPAAIRKVVSDLLLVMIKKQPSLRSALDQAMNHVATEPVVEQPKSMIPVVPVPKEMSIITKSENCISFRPFWTSKNTPKYLQPIAPLAKGIAGARSKELLDFPKSVRVVPAAVPVKDIQEGLRIEKALAKKAKEIVGESWRTNLSIASRLCDIFLIPNPVSTIDTSQSQDTLRDISKGILANILSTISKDATKQVKFEEMKKTDITLVSLLMNLEAAKATTNTLRAQERNTFTERLRNMRDNEREITKELIDRGMAPYITTDEDRKLFAKQMSEKVAGEIDVIEAEDAEVGVGRPIENPDGEPIDGAGNYGDQGERPANDGGDYEQADINDDNDMGI
jgi:hypothetical protein